MKWIKFLASLWTLVMLFGIIPVYGKDMIVYCNTFKPPKYWKDKNGQKKGILVDITKWVGKEIGYKFDITLLPWQRAQKYAIDGSGGIIG